MSYISNNFIDLYDVKVVLNDKFLDDIATPLNIQVYVENEIVEPPNPDNIKEYIYFTVREVPDGGFKEAPGTYRKLGLATAQIFTPLGIGFKRSDEIAKAIKNAFQDQTWAANVLKTEAVSTRSIGKSGSYHQTNTTFTFEFSNSAD